jgi:hypothetical protein
MRERQTDRQSESIKKGPHRSSGAKTNMKNSLEGFNGRAVKERK